MFILCLREIIWPKLLSYFQPVYVRKEISIDVFQVYNFQPLAAIVSGLWSAGLCV